LGAALAVLGTLGAAQVAAKGVRAPLERRMAEVRSMVSDRPTGLEQTFAAAFRKAVPPARMKQILGDYYKKGGRVVSVLQVSSKGSYFAEYRFYTDKKKVFPVKLGVGAEPPHQIHTLWFGGLSSRITSMDRVLEALKGLPGEVSFALCQLGAGKPKLAKALNPNLSLAVGSTFKLYVLGALIKAVDEGRQRWDTVVQLRKDWASWPSGVLQTWPEGAPLTRATLAAKMISRSDNTATDHLLFSLGRPRVEAMLEPMGMAKSSRQRNLPFLSTREMFRLKEAGKAKGRIAAYLGRDVDGRRKYLQRELGRLDREEFEGLSLSRPTAVDQVEWFASAADLCRAMGWLKSQTRDRKTALGRQVLAINRGGLSFRDKYWRYIGYKGGSEPGVLNMTWLLRRRDGRWLVLTGGWNNTAARLDADKLTELLQSVVLLLER
jgi:hypothetical protein